MAELVVNIELWWGRLNKYPLLRKSGKGDERRKCQAHHHHDTKNLEEEKIL